MMNESTGLDTKVTTLSLLFRGVLLDLVDLLGVLFSIFLLADFLSLEKLDVWTLSQ